MNAYSKKGFSSFYFNGQQRNIPDEPLEGIRIVFQDLVLIESGGHSDDKTKAATAVNVLDKTLSEENGPYIVVLWTNHKKIIKFFKDYSKKLKSKPLEIIDRVKSDFIEYSIDEKGEHIETFNFSKIQKMVEELYNKYASFKILCFWENIIQKAVNSNIVDFGKITSDSNSFDKELMNLFYSLAKAEMGKTIEKREEEILQRALVVFNSILMDSVESMIIENCKKSGLKLVNTDINGYSSDIRALINFKLNMTKETINQYPGNIYFESEVKTRCENETISKIKTSRCSQPTITAVPIIDFVNEKDTSIMYKIFNSDKIKESYADLKKCERTEIFDSTNKVNEEHKKEFDKYKKNKLKEIGKRLRRVHIDISALCDYAQGKLENHRMVRGYMIPEKDIEYIRKAGYLYPTFMFSYEEKNTYIVVDFRYYFSIPPTVLNELNAIIRFRKSLLNELQAKLSTHVNRPALVYLEPAS